MHRPPIARGFAVATMLWVLLLSLQARSADADDAAGGEFAVSITPCLTEEPTFGSPAFGGSTWPNMWIAPDCDPNARETPKLVLANRRDDTPARNGSAAQVQFHAPPDTTFSAFVWTGWIRRVDCRWSLKLYGETPEGTLQKIENVRANEKCPRGGRPDRGRFSQSYPLTGATRIVQRVICGGAKHRGACPARDTNYIRTEWAEAVVHDEIAPTVSILDTALTRGEWVRGTLRLQYDARDGVGVRTVQATMGEVLRASEDRACAAGTDRGKDVVSPLYTTFVPCPSGPGEIELVTGDGSLDGTHELKVQVLDAVGNDTTAPLKRVRIDNRVPQRVAVGVRGGEGWRNTNDFVVEWENDSDPGAPIVVAHYKLCSKSGCTGHNRAGAENFTGFPIPVPSPGEWTLSMWRGDKAGNATDVAASVPVNLRYDPEPPQLGFEAPAASDPTLVAVRVDDKVSGLADGAIEIGREGSDTWQVLPTQVEGGRLVARIDDAGFPAGRYVLRASARDQARNEASTSRRLDGEPMTLQLPLRVTTTMQAGVPRQRVVKRTVVRDGKRRRVGRRVTVLLPAAVVRSRRHVDVVGRLADSEGQPIAGVEVQVLSRSTISHEQPVAMLQTDADGRYRFTADGSATRVLRLLFAGTPLILPAAAEVRLTVPAETSIAVSRRRVLAGEAVMFGGQLGTLPVPGGGKLVELQVRLPRGWQTFRTARTDTSGRWRVRYRFARTEARKRGRDEIFRYPFRAWLPHEAGYPFAAGTSRSLSVDVRSTR